jgi:hypothetical protein
MIRRGLRGLAMGMGILAAGSISASAQTPGTASEFWPGLAVRYQWPSALSLRLYSEIKNAEDFPYQQLGIGGQVGYQLRAMTRPHLTNIDPEKNHNFFFGAGYEYLATIQSGKSTTESRVTAQVTGRHRPAASVLVEDRNLMEFRWVNAVYQTRYRNKLSLEVDVLVRQFRFTPYASAEVFYSWAKGSWNEQQYAVGVRWPFKKLLKIDTYYLRQNCTTCAPAHVNAAGLALSVYFGSVR